MIKPASAIHIAILEGMMIASMAGNNTARKQLENYNRSSRNQGISKAKKKKLRKIANKSRKRNSQ